MAELADWQVTEEAIERRRLELEMEPHALAWVRIERAIAATDGSTPDRAAAIADIRFALAAVPEPDVRSALAREAERLARNAGIEMRASEVLRAIAAEERSAERDGRAEREAQGQPIALSDPEPSNEPVDGAPLLDDLAGWLHRYVWFVREAADAVALWIVASWFVGELYFAPVLALLSPTKRCGKTLLLDLLRHVVRRGYLTSGTGVTAAVIFRLNEAQHPTFLIDEAEKLAGRHADRDLIGMLNAGHRRGAKATRCESDTLEVREYDAFGFRALAAIGTLWDSILDRSIVLRLERKPKATTLERFHSRRAEREGKALATRLRRWTDDHRAGITGAEEHAPRPEWLDDRECDHWSGLFAVAALAGDGWPERAVAAAKALRIGEEERDYAERLLHDVRRAFDAKGKPEVIPSGELAKALNDLDEAPWGDQRGGSGLSTHGLAARLRDFKVRPRADHAPSLSKTVRGYWLADLTPVWARYAPPPTLSEVLGSDGVLEENPHEIRGNLGSNTSNTLGDSTGTPDSSGVCECGRDIYRDGLCSECRGGIGPGLEMDVPPPVDGT